MPLVVAWVGWRKTPRPTALSRVLAFPKPVASILLLLRDGHCPQVATLGVRRQFHDHGFAINDALKDQVAYRESDDIVAGDDVRHLVEQLAVIEDLARQTFVCRGEDKGNVVDAPLRLPLAFPAADQELGRVLRDGTGGGEGNED